VIFAAGTGNPYFTTDTTAALRAVEVARRRFSKPPKSTASTAPTRVKDPSAGPIRTARLSAGARTGTRSHGLDGAHAVHGQCLPIVIFNMFRSGNIRRVVMGEAIGRSSRGVRSRATQKG